MTWDGIATQTFADKLEWAASNGTGCLEVHDATRERRGWVFLEDQDVIAVLVDGYQPRLARRLTASGLVSIADMGEILAVTKGEYDPRIADECVTRGLVDATTMEILYREFMLSAASSVDEWDLGDTQWVDDVAPWEGRSTAVPVPALVTAMTRRKEHWAQLWAELSAVTIPDRVPVRTGPENYQPESPDEDAILAAVNGKRTVDQVAGECGFTRFQAGHLLAGLMAKKVLDLFPPDGPRPTPDSLSVEAGYYAHSQPIPEPDENDDPQGTTVPDAGACEHPVVHAREHLVEPPVEPLVSSPSWAVPVAVSVPVTAVVNPTGNETRQAEVTNPVTTDDIEGDDVTQHVEVEVEVEDTPVSYGHADLPDSLPAVDPPGPEAHTPENVMDSIPDYVTDHTPEPTEPTEPVEAVAPGQVAPVSYMAEFFVNNGPVHAPEPAPAEPVIELVSPQPGLPPLPAITGGPSDFYAALPSTLSRLGAGVPPTTLNGLPGTSRTVLAHPDNTEPAETDHSVDDAPMPVGEPASGTETETVAVVAVVDPSPTPVPATAAVDTEIDQLKADLIRLSTEKNTAAAQAAALREQAATHTAAAVQAAFQVDETAKSIAQLKSATSEASATAASQLRTLELAQGEETRLATIRTQLDHDTEQARKALAVSQQQFDESSAAHTRLEHDLKNQITQQDAITETWANTKDSAVRSAANAQHADAAADECDQLIKEALERLVELAAPAQ